MFFNVVETGDGDHIGAVLQDRFGERTVETEDRVSYPIALSPVRSISPHLYRRALVVIEPMMILEMLLIQTYLAVASRPLPRSGRAGGEGREAEETRQRHPASSPDVVAISISSERQQARPPPPLPY